MYKVRLNTKENPNRYFMSEELYNKWYQVIMNFIDSEDTNSKQLNLSDTGLTPAHLTSVFESCGYELEVDDVMGWDGNAVYSYLKDGEAKFEISCQAFSFELILRRE